MKKRKEKNTTELSAETMPNEMDVRANEQKKKQRIFGFK